MAFGHSLLVPMEVEDKCLTENNTTRMDLYAKIDQAKTEGHFENIEMNYMCYVHCAAAELEILDANEQLDIEVFKQMEHLQEENAEVIEECHRVISQVEDKCAYAFQMLVCYIKNYRIVEYLNIMPGKQ
ncbi:uncharacterized protein LOC108653144 [Drosophila navojoa]|uniref:uncharacterized protein LOC108653144 n=1 Tax=Drosophila navojoa TaxID=7232 RepID=UPI000847CA65|nr:uncharacterized protein LOC108653144 [Drosophila navojoa]